MPSPSTEELRAVTVFCIVTVFKIENLFQVIVLLELVTIDLTAEVLLDAKWPVGLEHVDLRTILSVVLFFPDCI